jgi:hypothetical protein
MADAPHALQHSLETILKLEEQLTAVGIAVDDTMCDLRARQRRAKHSPQLDGRQRRGIENRLTTDAQESEIILQCMEEAKT